MKVRERIVETATTLFHKQGYRSTGINQIITEANVAKGSFYYNFKSKEEVCIASLDARHLYWFDQLKAFVAKQTSTAPGSKPAILTAFDFLKAMNTREDFRGCNFLNILAELSPEETGILNVIQNHKQDLRVYLASLLPNTAQSDHVYLLFESAIMESKLYRAQWPIVKAREIVQSTLNRNEGELAI